MSLSAAPERSITTTREAPRDVDSALGSFALAGDLAMQGRGLQEHAEANRRVFETHQAEKAGLLAAGAVNGHEVRFDAFAAKKADSNLQSRMDGKKVPLMGNIEMQSPYV